MTKIVTTASNTFSSSASHKRKRDEEGNDDDWWPQVADWIRTTSSSSSYHHQPSSGFVHEAIQWNSVSRSLTIHQRTILVGDNSTIANNGREISVLPKDTLLMRIPTVCQLFWSNDAVVSPSLRTSLESIAPSLRNDIQDVALALVLTATTTTKTSVVNNNNHTSTIGYYQKTLPTEPPSLPRFWDVQERKQLLTGSTLLDRTEQNLTDVEHDFSVLKSKGLFASLLVTDEDEEKKASTTLSHLKESFHQHMAFVTSRAFGGMGVDGGGDTVDTKGQESALIPLLDLCNHCRGQGEKKNVRYVRGKNGDDAVYVYASQDIASCETLRITYGALGNGPLLLNYGFCLEDNLEPDGSSNSVVECRLSAEETINGDDSDGNDGTTMELRTGPKSYTFGPFTRIMELFMDTKSTSDQEMTDPAATEEDDMEAFLNACDDDEEEGGMSWAEDEGGEEGVDNEDDVRRMRMEMEALRRMQKALTSVLGRYTMTDAVIQATLFGDDDDDNKRMMPHRHAALFIQSEKRTIQFFKYAAFRLEQRLKERLATMISSSNMNSNLGDGIHTGGEHVPPADYDDDTSEKFVWSYIIKDVELLEKQADELVTAFIQIRHSDMMY